MPTLPGTLGRKSSFSLVMVLKRQRSGDGFVSAGIGVLPLATPQKTDCGLDARGEEEMVREKEGLFSLFDARMREEKSGTGSWRLNLAAKKGEMGDEKRQQRLSDAVPILTPRPFSLPVSVMNGSPFFRFKSIDIQLR
ncbi:hypothetical protein BHM03_00013074 [Ensete ventricosum]|uniref:Uncharacterized protein n=1 Tax=Ensete ventricosum TaxID=4639 RepID=A0A445MDP1_ENSVE|nr:hypothetical protein BHM03_00013074 [Ensete ventricosum]